MNFEKNNNSNIEAFLSVYTKEMGELLSGEVCEALLKKRVMLNSQFLVWWFRMWFMPLPQKQHKR